MEAPRIKTDTYYIPSRGRSFTRFVAAVNGVWLVRKDGVIRKFLTRHAARQAAIKAAGAETTKESA